MKLRSKIEEIKKIINFRDYHLYQYYGDPAKTKYEKIEEIERILEDKFLVLSEFYPPDIVKGNGNIERLIEYNDLFIFHWFDGLQWDLWEFIINHHKPTGEIIYAFAQHLIPIYQGFEDSIEKFKSGVQIEDLLFPISPDPNNTYFTNSMGQRLLIFKSFILSLDKFASNLNTSIIITKEPGDDNKMNELANKASKEKKHQHKFKSIHTRYKLLDDLKSDLDSILKNILIKEKEDLICELFGIHIDTARHLIEGTYSKKNEEELVKLKEYINKLKHV